MTNTDNNAKPRKPKGTGSVSPATRGGFQVSVTIDGQSKYFRAKTRKEGEDKLREALNRADNGTLVYGREYTVAEWFTHWLSIGQWSDATYAGYVWNVEHFIIPELGKHKLSALRVEHCETLYRKMMDGTLGKNGGKIGASGVRNVHANVRGGLNVAMKRGNVARNVALNVQNVPKQGKSNTSSFSREDTRTILAHAKEDRYAARWFIGMMTGMRPAEMLGLTWGAVDFQRKELHVRAQLVRAKGKGLMWKEKVKTDAGYRTIKLNDVLLTMLAETREQQLRDRVEMGDKYTGWDYNGEPVALVFAKPSGKPVETRVDSENWKKLLERAGVAHKKRYTSRHTAATLALDMGIAIEVVSAMLGHARTSFTYDTYVHPLEDAKTKAADLMAQLGL